jgi:hypothetical protein
LPAGRAEGSLWSAGCIWMVVIIASVKQMFMQVQPSIIQLIVSILTIKRSCNIRPCSYQETRTILLKSLNFFLCVIQQLEKTMCETDLYVMNLLRISTQTHGFVCVACARRASARVHARAHTREHRHDRACVCAKSEQKLTENIYFGVVDCRYLIETAMIPAELSPWTKLGAWLTNHHI